MKRTFSILLCSLFLNSTLGFAQTLATSDPDPLGLRVALNSQEILRLAQEIYKLQVEHEMAERIEREKAEAFRLAVGHEYQQFFTFVAKYIAPAIATWLIATKVAK